MAHADVHHAEFDLVKVSKVRVLSHLEERLMTNAVLRSWREQITANLVTELSTMILGMNGLQAPACVIKTLTVPASLWQHIKESLFSCRAVPGFVSRRWPVRYSSYDLTQIIKEYRICPHADVKWQDQSTVHLSWMTDNSEREKP